MSGVFTRPSLIAIIAIAAASLVTTVILAVLGDDPTSNRSAGADAYSRSAIGQRAFVEMLRELQVPVTVTRQPFADPPKHGLLVIDEPQPGSHQQTQTWLRDRIRGAGHVLVVLPKWYGFARAGAPWIDHAALLPADDVEKILDALELDDVKLARDSRSMRWVGSTTSGDFDIRVSPVTTRPQLVTFGAGLEPIIATEDRVLLARFEVENTDVWLLTDPDVVSNAGLRVADNAQFAVALIDKLRQGGAVVFDEGVHGHTASPSLLRVLFQFPLVLVTLQVLMCAIIAVWAAMMRFGPRRASPPAISPGKDFLIRNTAALLAYGGHHHEALRRYLAASIATVRHRLHVADGLSAAATTAWLERVRLARGGTISLPDLERAVIGVKPSPQAILELADLVYRWRKEMTDGPKQRS